MFFDTLPHDQDRPNLTFKEGVLTLSGNCLPADPLYTLGIIFQEVYDYLKYHDFLTINFKFSNVGTASSKIFLDFFIKLNKIHKEKENKIRIYWYSPNVDEDIAELGEFYKGQSDLLAKKEKYKPLYFKLKYYDYE